MINFQLFSGRILELDLQRQSPLCKIRILVHNVMFHHRVVSRNLRSMIINLGLKRNTNFLKFEAEDHVSSKASQSRVVWDTHAAELRHRWPL